MKIAERYSRATSSSHLSVTDQPGDADVLISAGWADKGSVALSLYRMKHSGRPIGFHGVARELDVWLRKEAGQFGVKHGGKHARQKVVEPTVFWWLNNVCVRCEGRGHPSFKDSPVMDDSIDCPDCLGSGRSPLGSLVQPEYLNAANLLLNYIERESSDVFDRMKVNQKC